MLGMLRAYIPCHPSSKCGITTRRVTDKHTLAWPHQMGVGITLASLVTEAARHISA